MQYSIDELEDLARQVRWQIVKMSHQAKAAHLGSALSCVDILTALYYTRLNVNPENFDSPDRDRFILSKGHAASALYAILACKNILPALDLERYCKPGSMLGEHPSPYGVPGVEAATGSLGHGLSLGLGMALAGKIKQEMYDVFILLSDGECNEGAVWEAAMFAPAKKVSKICAIIDFNKWQATGRSCDIMALEPLVDKWRAFGWSAVSVNGHDMGELVTAFAQVGQDPETPTVIVAHTVKGKGVSFMEDDNNWHYRIPSSEELEIAEKELMLI